MHFQCRGVKIMAKHYDFDEDFESGEILDRISNGEESVYFVRKDDGIYCSDGIFICDNDDEEYQDKIDEYKEGWREVNWNQSDWADYYGCEEDEVDDAMDDDWKDW